MRRKLLDAAFAACFVLSAAMTVIAGAKGLGTRVNPGLEFWVLEAMHLAFILAFVPASVDAFREGRRVWGAVYVLPLAAFFVYLAGALAGARLSGVSLVVFDLYLIVVSVIRLSAFPEPSAPTEGDYQEIPQSEAYGLLNTGGLVMVCTKGAEGRYDLAPIAWNCPLDYDPTSRVLIVMDPAHRTVENIEASGCFVLALPTYRQKALIDGTGSVSGRDADKYEKFRIRSLRGREIDALIPSGSAGWLECRTIDIRRIGSVAVIAGEVVYAKAVKDAWKHRLHYAGEKAYYRPLTRG